VLLHAFSVWVIRAIEPTLISRASPRTAGSASWQAGVSSATPAEPEKHGPSSDPAACLTGTWRAVEQQFSASINGQQTLFTGAGAIATLRPDGTCAVVLRDDGVVNNSGPLESAPGVTPYQCSGNTLREYFTNGGDDELTRETPR